MLPDTRAGARTFAEEKPRSCPLSPLSKPCWFTELSDLEELGASYNSRADWGLQTRVSLGIVGFQCVTKDKLEVSGKRLNNQGDN